jgi:phosphonatase-like hydrolase
MLCELAALDIAGTTVAEGGAVYRVLAEVVRDHGGTGTDAQLRAWMGADKREAITALLARPGVRPDRARVEVVHTAFVTRLTAAYAAAPPVPLPGVVEAFAALRAAGVRIALTTGFDRQVTDPLLAALGWGDGELDAVVCAEEVTAGRPAPFMIQRAMQLTGVTDPARVLVAGDTVLDVRAGHAAHAGLVVGVLTGGQSAAELAAERPTHVLAGVHLLPGLLSGRPGAGPQYR